MDTEQEETFLGRPMSYFIEAIERVKELEEESDSEKEENL
tara:strand:- start:455 stop:574 length:120 start_codon:yes stop_codon:yes gene_type:complete